MYYYEIALLNSPLDPLTYHYETITPIGTLVEVKLRNRVLIGVVIASIEKPIFKTLSIDKVLNDLFDAKQIRVAKFISTYYFSSLGEALNLFIPFTTKSSNNIISVHNKIAITLSSEQDKALQSLKKAPVSLLFGDTGSGKTEIYMKYFDEVIEKGKKVLFLMPEISLTPQMQIRLEEHFGDAVVMWHSKVTKPQKKKLLERI